MVKISWVNNEEDFFVEFARVHEAIEFVIDLMLYNSFNNININFT